MQTQQPEVNVLVVDDEPHNLLAYEAMIQGLDVNLVKAGSGSEALRYLIAHEAAVIFMDVSMPDMDGFETSALIRQRDQLRTTPLIFVTAAYRDDISKIRGYAAGAVDYLEKPVVVEIFRSKVAVFADLFRKTEEAKRQTLLLVEARRQEQEKHLAEERQRWETERLQAELATEKQHVEQMARNAGIIRQLNETLTQQNVGLAETNRQLTEKNQENEMFVYSVSHDLRSPLVNLHGFSKELAITCQELRCLLAENDLPQSICDRSLTLLDGPVTKSVHFIQTAVTRLSSIIDALLRLSRAGRVEYKRVRVDVKTVVTRVVDSMNGAAEERGAAIQLHDLPPACGDPTAVEQVFANLLGNALKYLDPRRRGLVEVGYVAKTPDASATGLGTYYVKDNGLGIPEAGKAKIFQPFQRLHPEAAPGEGMGLAIAQRIVERHGGRIWVESAVGEGSTFLVTLPAYLEMERETPSSPTEGE